MHFGHTPVVAGDEAVKDFGQKPPLLQPQAAHDAEIDSCQAALLIEEQIALMHVGMKKTIAHCVTQKGLDDRPSQRRQINDARLQGCDIRQWRAIDPFQCQDRFGCPVPVYLGKPEIGIMRNIFSKLRRSRGLEPEVHFHPDRTGQRFDDLDKFQTPRLRKVAFGEPGGEKHVIQIASKSPLDAGAQNLNRNISGALSVDNPGLVDLGDRGRRNGLAESDKK